MRPFGRKQSRTHGDVCRASHWRLGWWLFADRKLAVFAALCLSAGAAVCLFADFFAPYSPATRSADHGMCPPLRLRIRDSEGKLHLRPFVYPLTPERDPVTLRLSFREDRSRVVPLRFFVRGETYSMWGVIDSDLHLFGSGMASERLYLLGGDRFGRDALSRLVHGGRTSLGLALAAAVVSVLSAAVVGCVSAARGGGFDALVQRVLNVLSAIPRLPLCLALSAALPRALSGPERFVGLCLVLCLAACPGLVRSVRRRFLLVKGADFIAAAQLDGSGPLRLFWQHVRPAMLTHTIAAGAQALRSVLAVAAVLSFLGVGWLAPAVSWGVLLRDALGGRVSGAAPWLLLPAVCLVLCIFALRLIADGLSTAAEPYGIGGSPAAAPPGVPEPAVDQTVSSTE